MKLEEEILISAYLDGELAGDEEVRAEKLLAASAEARQLADEMRAVRNRLQGLPRLSLPADFAGQTVRRAEQELAAAKSVDTAIGSPGPQHQARQSSSQPAAPSTWASWRMYAWAAVALAAGLMIMLNNRLPDVKYQTAQQPYTTEDKAPEISVGTSAKSNEPTTPVTPQPNALATDSATPPPKSNSNVEVLLPSFSRTGQSTRALNGVADDVRVGAAAPQTEISPNEAVNLDRDGYMLVTVRVTPEAAKGREFKELLAKHQIAIGEESEKAGSGQAGGQQGKPVAGSKNLKEWMPDFDATGKGDVFYAVEASPEQLTDTIRDLAADNDWCKKVSVTTEVVVKKSEHEQQPAAPRMEAAKSEPPVAPASAPPAPSPAPQVAAEEAAQPAPGPVKNSPAIDLLTPKPAEPGVPADGKRPTDPADRRDGETQSGRATRLANPTVTKSEGAGSTESPKTSRPQEVKPDAPETLSVGKSEPAAGDKLALPVAAKGVPPRRAIFVLRVVEPAPAAATPAPAAPK